MKTAFLFSGQGAQQVGMGRDLYEASAAAREVFEATEGTAAISLRALCFDGPEDQLARTDVCQPAIFAVSAAVLAAMSERLGPDRMPKADFMAGLSLGEYTALHAAGAMDLPTAARLVAWRGQAMQAAAAAAASGMVSILGIDEQGAEALCRAAAAGQVLTCANFNCPGQIVLSGELQACRRAAERAKDFGATTAVMLNVAGAFHSRLMAPAADDLAKVLANEDLAETQVPVIANVTGRPYEAADRIAPTLVAQLTSPIRWQQSMEYLLGQGVGRFYEIGPGRVLAGLMRRTDRRAKVTCVNSWKAIEKLPVLH